MLSDILMILLILLLIIWYYYNLWAVYALSHVGYQTIFSGCKNTFLYS